MMSVSFFSADYGTLHLPFCNFQGSVVTCNTCHGSGMYIRIHQIGPGMVQQIHTQCRDCGGSGERIPGNVTFSNLFLAAALEAWLRWFNFVSGSNFIYNLLLFFCF